jgi:hypothetical protein
LWDFFECNFRWKLDYQIHAVHRDYLSIPFVGFLWMQHETINLVDAFQRAMKTLNSLCGISLNAT